MTASIIHNKAMRQDGACGYLARDVFVRTNPGYSLDDVIYLPGYIDFALDAVNFQTALSARIQLRTPLLSHPAVTGARMATAVALLGGLGIVGGSCLGIAAQVEAVSKVKRFENGFIHEPVTLGPEATVSEVDEINHQFGFSTVPVVSEGKLLGLVTARDIDFIPPNARASTKLHQVMTPVARLVTLTHPVSLADANAKLRAAKVGKLPIVDVQGCLVALVSRNDLLKNKEYPLASKDANKQLLVGAAVDVTTFSSLAAISDAVAKLVHEAGVDLLYLQGPVIGGQVEAARLIRSQFPDVTVLASEVATIAELAALADEGGVHAVTVATSRAQATAIFQLAEFARLRGVAVVGDPDVRNSGHVVKTLGLGASAVMVGSLFRGTSEERGNENNGRATQQPQTGGGTKGSVLQLIPYYMQGAKHGFQDLGARTVAELHDMLRPAQDGVGGLRMEIRSGHARKEGNVHDLAMIGNTQNTHKQQH